MFPKAEFCNDKHQSAGVPVRNFSETKRFGYTSHYGCKVKDIMNARKIIKKKRLSQRDIDRIVQMAWEDRTPFGAIEDQFGVREDQVIKLMRYEMKPSSFRMWRQRVQGRPTKHRQKRNFKEGRHHADRQRSISRNKVT